MKMRRARKTLTLRHGVVRVVHKTDSNGIQTTRWHWALKYYVTRKGARKGESDE